MRLLPDYMADLLSTMVKMTKRTRVDGNRPSNHRGLGFTMKEEPDFKAKDSFQNHMSLKLFGITVSAEFVIIVYRFESSSTT